MRIMQHLKRALSNRNLPVRKLIKMRSRLFFVLLGVQFCGLLTLALVLQSSSKPSPRILKPKAFVTWTPGKKWSLHHDSASALLRSQILFWPDFEWIKECNENGTSICLNWFKGSQLQASLRAKDSSTQAKVSCSEIVLKAPQDREISACMQLDGAQLYGGGIKGLQYWPSQHNIKDHVAYVTGMDSSEGVVEPYWLTSSGIAVFVPPDVPLFVSQNKTHLCLAAKIESPYLPDDTGEVSLQYHLCSGSDPVTTHMHATQSFLPLPRDIPAERVFRHPIWSTWARYKKNINTSIVSDFADQILHYGFNNSQLEIDDNWETCYGSAEFDVSKFEDPKGLVQSLKNRGFHVTLWTHPFFNLDCPAREVALQKHYLCTGANNSETLTKWWNGVASMINITNPEAATWWADRLVNIIDRYNFDDFKYDAGEAGFLPGSPEVGRLNAPIRLQPNVFTTQYVQTVASISDQKAAEVRVVYRNQGEPIFARMSDKKSTWDTGSGLKSLVTTLLAMNMVGYSFVMPDMVGGNGYGNFPDKELFIRWLQANTFMPTIQFSFAPWDYDDETVEIAKKFTSLHYQYSDKILELARKKVADGTPINLPLWWLDPTDEETLTIDSEYLLGEDILVAPILDQGALERDIYLPAGSWRDELHLNVTYPGRQWLRNYRVELHQLAYFTRVP
ncbi:myogenesis-regulating glycosidase-like [Periplaneta americana]|uniref:myogenesis-regulating glycosidase-like n=1 Tax=Periplaneta americana TaxID=6978 RepID=UPI0037E92417